MQLKAGRPARKGDFRIDLSPDLPWISHLTSNEKQIQLKLKLKKKLHPKKIKMKSLFLHLKDLEIAAFT